MKLHPSSGILTLMLALVLPTWAADKIAITQKNGDKSIEVAPIELKDRSIRFSLNGREFNFPLSKLTDESRAEVEAWHKSLLEKQAVASSQINEVIGASLFSGNASLWQEPAADVAKRLGWRCESVAKSSSSYRSYPNSRYRLLGTRPYCYTLYGNAEGKTGSLSVVFANKGDFNSNVGFGADHFKKKEPAESDNLILDTAIRHDAETISKMLTEVFGEPTDQRYGEKEDRRDVMRWDLDDHAFILSEREGEYTHLLIVDRVTADAGGKVKFIKDQDLRETLTKNVAHEENGDTYITNIPMVNQGPKGYCAPATFERAMRYMHVPADMYLLATLATAAGGGTNTGKLAEEAKRIISSKARRIKELELSDDLDIRLVKRYVDKGVPILWQMASVEIYNETANKLSKQRKAITDISTWATEIAAVSESILPILENTSNHHICMIIGYNEASSEIAVSDSWGPSYALRWVPIDMAKAVTTSGGFVIDL